LSLGWGLCSQSLKGDDTLSARCGLAGVQLFNPSEEVLVDGWPLADDGPRSAFRLKKWVFSLAILE
jgi:hypothetical protein